ncbi:MAG TPA: ATP-dependent RNA helicase DbpA [Rheinheimera sp.]|uniref:ATP-dependent RNA helicase DbpA n=1 Tax=unclassified Rheinheimera TaxID=115860 RepID=UPI000EDF49AA|nr:MULTISPECIES: ATP-dependent RNA helicase DbpA [unclassified Rheinheimera]MCT6700163.1 ATP-dependent RNA helicase DbpA [Rheinheimera sp. 4Y26]HCU66484.1 ATP-dependent RNA helicase DbpA [Rheinheimera sp.]
MNNLTFASLALPQALVDNLTGMGYTEMTPIQAASLPEILSGKDVIGQGKTGSGKTAAFGLGILAKLNVKRFRVQSLVLCPTRELADQVATEIRKLGRSIHNIKVLTLCGGVPFGPQLGSLEHGAHIIVGTPGRVEEHLNKGSLKLDDLTTLVLDEADRMLEMGFQPALDAIVAFAPKQRQTLLFSATYPKQIEAMAAALMQQPQLIKVESSHSNLSISQHFFKVNSNADRLQSVKLLLLAHKPVSSVVFCNTRKETQEVADALDDAGFSVQALHGDLEQRDRDQTLVRFANKSVSVLVATDVAARGLDIDALDAVINYQLAHDVDTHTHRIGRTGRAGSSGIACSLFSEQDGFKIALLEDLLGPIKAETLPDASVLTQAPARPPMVSLWIDAGKRQKLRAGDILGALTADQQLGRDHIGKISLFDDWAYVAVRSDIVKIALGMFNKGIKGRNIRVKQVS